MREFSSKVLDGPDRAPSRAMLYPVGFEKDDFNKPKIGVASTWSQVTPCNFHIDGLAKESANGVDAAGGKSVIFNTITISDGISMGTEGMKYSLVSREVIADSIETVVGCEGMDGYVAIGGCDKNMPGCVMAMARMNRPSVFVYGGTILPGCATLKGEDKDLDIVSVFEAVGKHASGEYSDEELQLVEETAIPGAGSCGGMYTANTMASAIEALGMSLPNSSALAKRSSKSSNSSIRIRKPSLTGPQNRKLKATRSGPGKAPLPKLYQSPQRSRFQAILQQTIFSVLILIRSGAAPQSIEINFSLSPSIPSSSASTITAAILNNSFITPCFAHSSGLTSISNLELSLL